MPTIEDLKKQNVSASISVGGEVNSVKPTQSVELEPISINANQPAPVKKERKIVSNPVPNAAATISVLTGKEATSKGGRVAANFNSIPATDGSETLGVEIKESPAAEIFKPGGDFDKYVQERVEEVNSWYAKESAKAKAKAEEEEINKLKESGEIPEDEDDLDTNIAPALSGRIVDVTARKERKEDDMKINPVNVDQIKKEETPVAESDLDLDYEVEEEFEEEEEETAAETPVEPEPVSEVHNAEEIISEEPIKEEPPVEEKKSSVKDTIDRVTRRVMAVDIDDDEDLDEEVDIETTSDDENTEILRSLISEKIVPVSKKLDISSFAVANKGTSSNNIFETKEAAIGKWVLPATGICVLIREISGANLETMRSLLSRRIPDMRGALKIIYDHIVSPKPESFEVWLKSIAFADYDHLFMAIYIAAFAEANFMPIDCAECGKPYLTEDINIMDMVKFKDEKSEAKFTALYNAEPVNPNGLYVTENVAISDKFAVAFREPSLYSVLIESQYFDDKFTRKYQQAIAIMPYIDQVFFIDIENRRLVPVDFKLFANDPSKTARVKIKKLDAMLNTLSVDQNAVLATYTTKINERADWFTYQIPASTCPNCKHENPAQDNQSASSLVFLRNRLGALVTI